MSQFSFHPLCCCWAVPGWQRHTLLKHDTTTPKLDRQSKSFAAPSEFKCAIPCRAVLVLCAIAGEVAMLDSYSGQEEGFWLSLAIFGKRPCSSPLGSKMLNVSSKLKLRLAYGSSSWEHRVLAILTTCSAAVPHQPFILTITHKAAHLQHTCKLKPASRRRRCCKHHLGPQRSPAQPRTA